MRKNKFRSGWDKDRVRDVLNHYENQTEDEAVFEDEQAFKDKKQTIMELPNE